MVTRTENPIASGVGPQQEFDEALDDGLSVIQSIHRLRHESEQARRHRMHKSRRNRDVYLGRQDWSHKQRGQSREFLPKVPVSVEQLASTVKRGLVQFGPYFSVRMDNSTERVVTGESVRSIMTCFLDNLWGPNGNSQHFSTLVGDAVKQGLLESLIIFKVHGGPMKTRRFRAGPEDEEPEMEEFDDWRLRIDLVRPEDYYPDPTGHGLYEIHRVEKDLHEVVQGVEDGLYDQRAVNRLIGVDFPRPEGDQKRTEHDRNQEETIPPSFRKRVMLDEFWGTILNQDGTVAHRNVVATVANDRYLIRPPEPNPFWHQESPFVVAPLIRVPHSVWHKAIYDHASDLNLAINELYNLMLDGGIASVWGIKQLRTEDVEDPSQLEGGIRQGMTIGVKQTLPPNAKVLETVSEGEVPRDALAMYESLNSEFSQASMTTQLKMNQFPDKAVLATEVIESSQSQSLTLTGILADLETEVISKTLRKAWLTIMQNADRIPEAEFSSHVDRRVATILMRANPAERFALFANKCRFRVDGLTATMQRALEFQKFMALMQAVTTNPMLFQAFMVKFSPERALRHLMRILNMNPEDIQKTLEEQEQAAEELSRTSAAAQLLGQGPQNAEGQAAGITGGPNAGGSPQSAAIGEQSNMAGLSTNS